MADLQRLVSRTIGEETGPSHDPFAATDDWVIISRYFTKKMVAAISYACFSSCSYSTSDIGFAFL
jgi:hypothetical protein